MRNLGLLVLLAACGGSDDDKTSTDTLPTAADTDTDSDTDTDTDSDTDTDTDSDTDTDTDSDTDTDTGFVVTDTATGTTPTADTATTTTPAPYTYGTPIGSGCMAGITPRFPTVALAPYTLGGDGELGFDAAFECIGDVFDVTFEESNFSASPDAVAVDLWDLGSGAWRGEWAATNVGADLWGITTDPGNPPATCADRARLVFTGVGSVAGVPSAPTGTEDLSGHLRVWSAGYDLTGGGAKAIGTIEAPGADEVWFWALYPDHDTAYGPWPVPNTYADDHTLDVDLAAVGLRAEGMAFGFVSCEAGAITAAHGR